MIVMETQEKEYVVNHDTKELNDSAFASYLPLIEIEHEANAPLSSKLTFSILQKTTIFSLVICMGIQFYFNKYYPLIFLHIGANLTYILMILMRVYLLEKGVYLAKTQEEKSYIINDVDLPTYSIIIPLYKEEGVIDQLITHMQNIDYPDHLLRVFIVLEADDIGTKEELIHRDLPHNFVVLITPNAYPKTKPRACNYAMQFIHSDIVVIYDAEDIPHPQQLKDVASEFQNTDPSVACIQCQLYWYNIYDNWLTFMFAIEYKILFEYILPALDNLNMPIPLGGTSNHIRVDKLKEIGCWDEYNVTEDADLGIRLSRNGFKTKLITSHTGEECPISIMAWMKQRTRWIKGYLQTFIAHTSDIPMLVSDFGWRKTFFFICFIGISTISYLLAGISFLILVIQVMSSEFLYGEFIKLSSYCMMLCGFLFMMYQGYTAKQRFYNGKTILMKLWWTYPFYCILHIVASFRALYHLIFATYLWEKTAHSISQPHLD